MTKLGKLLEDVRGATAIEYALIGALVSIAAFAALQSVGSQLNTSLTKVATTMATSD